MVTAEAVHMPPFFLQVAAQSLGGQESLVQHGVVSPGVGVREPDMSTPNIRSTSFVNVEAM